MADIIGNLWIEGEQAQRLFRNQSPGDTISIRVRGTILSMSTPGRPSKNQTMMGMGHAGTPMINIEIEGVDG